MKQTLVLLPVMLLLVLAACHKKSNSSAHLDTNTISNVATSVDSSAVAQHYKVDVYAGRFIDASSGAYGSVDSSVMSFSIRHVTSTMAIFTSSNPVQTDDIDWHSGGDASAINDSVVFIGRGPYRVGRRTYALYGVNIGDTLQISWEYDNNNHPTDPEHSCYFEGVRVE